MADGDSKKAPQKLIELGVARPLLRVAWGLSREKYLGEEFFDEECTDDQRGKLTAVMKLVSANGGTVNDKIYKYPMKHTEGLGEFKTFKKRLFFFRNGDVLVITHGATKKENETDPNDIKRANRIRDALIGGKP